MRFLLALLLCVPLAGLPQSYEGEFKDGKYHGHGRLQDPDGRRYVGEFAHGRFHGQGRAEMPNGDLYEGEFRDGELTGQGTANLRDGTRYRGELLNWKPHGKGRLVDPAGNVYEGGFSEGRFDGEGTLRLKNGQVRSGKWKQGRPDDSAERLASATEIETALYRQRPLLDETLRALAPRQPGRINLYLLAVAGDGSQEVFRREVEFVQKQFDSEFGTRGRSVALINSRSTTATAPMATLTSLREALGAIAAKMDREQDILLLFMTSHASKEHEFLLNHGHMPLRSFKPQELAALLKESAIGWKAIVVSSCYSGGFIDALKDERTLVISASRHDRQSFGCADENDFTYFGRAFFKESLATSKSFDEAFSRAVKLVDEWEKRDKRTGNDASLPQIHSPRPIAEHLRRWWDQLGR
ncbi:MAG: C13 family peptidase [Betaproteobacteria bacterium]